HLLSPNLLPSITYASVSTRHPPCPSRGPEPKGGIPMNETTSLQNGSNPETGGLRSLSGIRWLLLAGSTVTGVSIFRLVQARWMRFPVPVQFLILVAGSLAIFGLGNVIRHRLHLPAAGSALLFLFTGLVPVMAWGAVYLKLLDTPAGWIWIGWI